MQLLNTTNSSVHYKWVIFFLFCILVSLLTVDLATNSNLVSYFSFAATISSLILSVLAIVYSFLTSASQSNDLQKITDASNIVKVEADKLSNAATEILSAMAKTSNDVLVFNQRFDTAHAAIVQISESFTQRDLTTGKENAIPDEASDDAVPTFTFVNLTKEQIHQIINTSPIGILLTLFLFSASHKNNKSFDIRSALDDSFRVDVDYVSATINIYKSLELISFEYNEFHYTITSFDEDLFSALQSKISYILFSNDVEAFVKELIVKSMDGFNKLFK